MSPPQLQLCLAAPLAVFVFICSYVVYDFVCECVCVCVCVCMILHKLNLLSKGLF